MFTDSHVNTLLGQSERVLYLSYFIRTFSKFAWNAELCHLKFFAAQQHPNIPIKHLLHLFHLIKDEGQDIFLIYCACFVSLRLKERDIFHMYKLLKNQLCFTFIPPDILTHPSFDFFFTCTCTTPDKIQAIKLCISGNLNKTFRWHVHVTLVFGDITSGEMTFSWLDWLLSKQWAQRRMKDMIYYTNFYYEENLFFDTVKLTMFCI